MKARNQIWPPGNGGLSVAGVVGRTTAVLAAAVLALASVARAQTERKVFAFEYTTESSQKITFVNHVGVSQDITVNIYEPGGAAWSGGAKTVSLNGFQTKTITPKDDWNLQKKATGESGHGTPDTDTAYGVVATSSVGSFAILTYSDEQEHAGSGYSAIYPRDTVSEAVWGMWNYNDNPGTSKGGKRDYFFLFNPNSTAAQVTLQPRKSDGTAIDANGGSPGTSKTITLAARQTQKIYPAVDLNSSPSVNNNIGMFMTSDSPVHVSVYTQLGQDYDSGSNPPWKTHDVVSGLYLPWTTECLPASYVWTDAKTSGQQQTASRITNPNNFAITVTEDWYPYDQSPVKYTTTTTIPAYGTAELPRAGSTFRDESGADLPVRNLCATGRPTPSFPPQTDRQVLKAAGLLFLRLFTCASAKRA